MSGRLTDICVKCGHERQHHIYNEGACRPGFVCEARCPWFEEPNPKKPVVEILLDIHDDEVTLRCGCTYKRIDIEPRCEFRVTWCERHGETRP